MKQSFLFNVGRTLAMVVVFLAPSVPGVVHATPIPEYVLNKDYENCLGGESEKSDPQRARFCECSRSKMRQWDLDTYGATATEAANNPLNTKDISQKIDEIASACLADSLK